jgi:hypothetical protein
MARDLTAKEMDIVEEGLKAQALLSDDTFQSVIKSLCLESWAQWTESKPTDTSGREANYNFYQGLKAIEAELNARVQAKDEIERMVNSSDDAAE